MKTLNLFPIKTYQNKSCFTHFSNLITVLIFLIGTFSDTTQGATDRKGVYLGAAYDATDIEVINKSNGNLYLNIPLASLPADRGGTGTSLSLFYNSKIWKSTTSGYTDTWGYPHVTSDVDNDPDGGWRYGLKYSWAMRSRFDDAPYPYQGDPTPCAFDDAVYAAVSEMIFPDGSTHVIHPRGEKEVDGFTNIRPNGWRVCGNYNSAPRRFYTTDGSYIKVDFYPTSTPSNNPSWVMYFPDGSKVTDNGQGVQRTYDRNGNYKEVQDIVYNNHPATRITDQIGREIILEHDSSNHRDYIYQQGFNNQQLKWTVYWQNISVNTQYYNGDSDQDGNPIIMPLNRSLSVINQIDLPIQLGSLTFSFEYSTSLGKGELTAITLPSGAKNSYKYNLFGSMVDCAGGTDSCTGGYVGNGIYTKTKTYNTEYDGNLAPVTEKWIYNFSLGQHNAPIESMLTGPDGSVIKEYYVQYPPYVYPNPYNPSGLEGLPDRVIDADGSVIEKLWQLNKIPNRNSIKQYNSAYAEQTNAQVKTEFISLPDSNGNLTKTIIKDYSYDKNGNQTQIVEYNFVDYATIPRNGDGKPTGIPSGLTFKRRTQNTYYAATPDANDNYSNDGNIYCNYGSPSNNRSVASTQLFDVNGQSVTRSEFFYDNAFTTGNLIETKSWDSTKGILPPAPGNGSQLDSSNSISTSTEYNQFGNPIATIDASGTRSIITYGCINGQESCVPELENLYPTQNVTAANYSELKRTSNITYDFSTGVVTSATDVDNNLISATEYDALARPVKFKAAVGTSHEIWTQSEYNDVLRRTVIRSDLETKGDGKKVTVQHYDELGRIWLSRTLENIETENPYNLQDGIKVQTRYRYDNGANPLNSNGSYVLTSNPYRAATSATASNEPSMGWSLSYTDKTEKSSYEESFSGAALPAPFGSNTASNGKVSSSQIIDRVMITDQAGKRRVSRKDAFGRVIDVWEVKEADADTESLSFGTFSLNGLKTSYQYDLLNNLTAVYQGLQQRNFSYSSLARLIITNNPESGTTNFEYDNNGNLVRKIDARQVITNYTFDKLNRIKNRTYSAPENLNNYEESLPVTYTYDNLPHAKGKLTKITTGLESTPLSITEYTEFDEIGRIKKSKQTTDGTAYPEMEYTYNLSNALIEEKYPSGRVVKNVLDVGGDLAIVQSKKSLNSGYWNYAEHFSYTAEGEVSSMQLGNGRWESTLFNSRLQKTQIGLGTIQNSTNLLKLDYLYGKMVSGVLQPHSNNGNIAKQTITVPTIGQANGFTANQYYEYDDLNRLTIAAENFNSNNNPTSPPVTTWAQYYTYDRYGNRRFNEQYTTTLPKACGTPTNPTVCANDIPIYNPTINQVKNQLNGYQFDDVGNTTKDAQHRKFTYDAQNKQSKVEILDGNNNVTALNGEYFYDGEGKRVKKIAYINGQPENTVFIYDVSGNLVAEYSTIITTAAEAKVSYLTNDSLGSPRIITDQNGSIESRHDYQPFGEEVSRSDYGTNNVRKKFTGFEKDIENNLDFAQNRYYSNQNGRFTSVDPLMASAKTWSPQSFNRYTYVNNNPTTLTDPTGLCPPEDDIPCVDGKPVAGSIGNFSVEIKIDENNALDLHVNGESVHPKIKGKSIFGYIKDKAIDAFRGTKDLFGFDSGGMPIPTIPPPTVPAPPDPSPDAPTDSDPGNSGGNSGGSSRDSAKAFLAWLVWQAIQQQLKEAQENARINTVRRFMSRDEYRTATRTGISYDPDFGPNGIPATTPNYTARNQSEAKRRTGAASAEYYVDFDVRGLRRGPTTNTKGGLPEYRIKANLTPDRIKNSGRVPNR